MNDQNGLSVQLEDVSDEVVITIRCLSAIPDDVEALLKELAAAESNG